MNITEHEGTRLHSLIRPLCVSQRFSFFAVQRYYHIQRAGCRFSSTGLDSPRWFVTAENPGNFCQPRRGLRAKAGQVEAYARG